MNTPAQSHGHVNGRARIAYVILVVLVLALTADAITGLMKLSSGASTPSVDQSAIVRVIVETIVLTVCTVLVAVFAGRALADRGRAGRARGDGSTPIVLMASATVVVPLFVLLVSLRFIQSELGLLVVFLVTVLPLSVWQMKTVYETIPLKLDDAARLDGCSGSQLFRLVIFPIIAPAVSAVAIFSAITAWIACMAAEFSTGSAAFLSITRPPAVLITALPPLVLFVVLSAAAAPKLRARFVAIGTR